MDKVGAKKNGSFMDILVSIFKNVWLKRGVALLCWSYSGLLVWLAWLNFAYFLEFENTTSLFVLYVFVNIMALALMTYTRNQVLTQVNVMIMPPVLFATFLLAFGNWYMILPPLCVVIAMFFICRANETLKTVLGTMYLLMYVIGAAGYITITLLMGSIDLTGVNTDLRDVNYERLSSDGHYRIVRYVDKPNGERRTASYYVEDATEDIEIPFGTGKKVLGCGWVLTTKYTSRTDDPVLWTTSIVDGEMAEVLSVEGSVKENPYLAQEIVLETEEDSSAPAGDTAESTEPGGTASASSEAAATAE